MERWRAPDHRAPAARLQGGTAHVNDATSYLAVSHIVARMLEQSPFGANGFSAETYLANLPQTDFVAGSTDGVMLQRGARYFLRQDNEEWKPYDTTP